jgi:hypothetical protein
LQLAVVEEEKEKSGRTMGGLRRRSGKRQCNVEAQRAKREERFIAQVAERGPLYPARNNVLVVAARGAEMEKCRSVEVKE